MDLGRILRATLMVLFLIPAFLALIFSVQAISSFLLLFVFSALFWFLAGCLISVPFGEMLWRFVAWIEGVDTKNLIDSSTTPFWSYLPEGSISRKTGKNQLLLFSEEFTTHPHNLIDYLERAFFPTSLIIGIEALFFTFIDMLGLYSSLLIVHTIFLFVLLPMFVCFIVIPIWLVNDTKARIFHGRTGEIRRIGNSIKDVLGAISGFGAIIRLLSLILATNWVILLTLFIILIIPLPIFLTTTVYLIGFHRSRLHLMEEKLIGPYQQMTGSEQLKPSDLTEAEGDPSW